MFLNKLGSIATSTGQLTNLFQKCAISTTPVSFFKKTVPGHIFRGKRRLVKVVTYKAMREQIKDYEQAEQNMLYLRNPYITLEQSSGHAKALEKNQKKIEFWNNNKLKPPFKPHVKIEDRLGHLRVAEKWD